MRRLIVACLALAAVSLLLPSAPTYDPWAWVVWGREILHLDLDTSGGPSWKPGPVLLTTLFAPLEAVDKGLPPALWLVVARAGALLAVALAFRLARRLTGEGWAGIVGGGLAALAILTLPLWLRYMAHGNEAPLAVALMLWALERHLDGRRDHAVALLFAACLLRPEASPLLAGEAALVWWTQPAARALVAWLLVALPVLWLVPEWIGSGNPFDAGRQAASEPAWSLSNAEKPWLAALERAHRLAGLELELAALAGVLWAAVRRARVPLVLAGVALAWLGLVVVMTTQGFSGANRYFLPPLAICCVLGGMGVARTLAAAASLPLPRPARVATATAVATGIAVLLTPFAIDRGANLGDQADSAERRVATQERLTRYVRRLGGAEAVLAPGGPWIPRAFQPALAWETDTHLAPWEKLPVGRPKVASKRLQNPCKSSRVGNNVC
jgi:hypothetical protein